jgi:hypothetical protein
MLLEPVAGTWRLRSRLNVPATSKSSDRNAGRCSGRHGLLKTFTNVNPSHGPAVREAIKSGVQDLAEQALQSPALHPLLELAAT